MQRFWLLLVFAFPYLAVCMAIAALALAVGGVPLLQELLPLAAGAVLVGTLGSALRLHAFRPGWLASRACRVQRELEFAATEWSGEGDPVEIRATLGHLRAAHALAAKTPLGERIAGVMRSVESHVESERSSAGPELMACLRAAAPARTASRQPFTSRLDIAPSLFLFEGSGLALAFVVWQERLGDGVSFWLSATRFVAVAFAVHCVLWLLARLELKRRVHRAHLGFRVLLVTDQPALDPINREAVRAYSSVGQLVALFASEEPQPGVGSYVPGVGGDLHFMHLSALPRMIGAFIRNVDVVVVHTRSGDVAAAVSNASVLPPKRRLALSQDGVVPSGFTWLNPIRLRIEPAPIEPDDSIDAATIWNLGRSYERLGLGDWLYGFAFVIGLGLSGFSGYRALGSLLMLGSVGPALPRLLGARRRATVSTTLRAPRSLTWSRRLLDAKRIARWTFGASLLLSLGTAALATHSFQPRWDQGPVIALCATSWLWASVIPAGVVKGVLRGLKWYVDWNFRVVVFRRNSRSFGYAHKATTMASCGAYGQVIVIQDASIETTDQDTGEWREAFEGAWLPIMSEMDHMLRPALFLQSWRRQVQAELARADCAVFDWAEQITDNMWWELTEALARLPAHRILIVAHEEHRANVAAWLASLPPGTARIELIFASRERDDLYIWPNNASFKDTFRAALTDMMACLHQEPRPPCANPAALRHPDFPSASIATGPHA